MGVGVVSPVAHVIAANATDGSMTTKKVYFRLHVQGKLSFGAVCVCVGVGGVWAGGATAHLRAAARQPHTSVQAMHAGVHLRAGPARRCAALVHTLRARVAGRVATHWFPTW